MSVKTNSKRSGVEEQSEGKYLVRVNSRPKEGRANEEVIKMLSKYFGVSKSNIEIISGQKSRKKLVMITGL